MRIKCRTLTFFLFLLLTSGVCFGQASFHGLTPGESTRPDVERALGRPLREVSEMVAEYAPPQGIGRVFVRYGGGSQTVERIEVHLLKAVTRAALLRSLGLPEESDARSRSGDGNLVEYFGGVALLSFTYATADTSGGVSRISYYSPALFERMSGVKAGPRPGTGTSGSSGGAKPPTLGRGDPRGDDAGDAGHGRNWTIPARTVLVMRMETGLTSKKAKVGDPIAASLTAPVYVGTEVVVPAGTRVEGRVTQVTPARRLSRPGMIAIDFDELVFPNGSRVKIAGILTSADPGERQKIDSEGGVSGGGGERPVVFIGGGSAVGAVIGAASGGGKGAAVGAATGAAVGVGVTLLAKGPEAEIREGLAFGILLTMPLVVWESFLSR